MISTLEEVRQLKRVVEQTRAALRHARVAFRRRRSRSGVMVEVPAAALCIDALLDEVDFVSIGSNDLIQYVMAADRDNPKVAHLCEPFNPAVFRLLRPDHPGVQQARQAGDAVRRNGRPAALLSAVAWAWACAG